MILDEFQSYGLTSTYGEATGAPATFDTGLIHVQKWMWDITNYCIELTIDFRQEKHKVATGISYRTALAKKSPQAMVEKVLGDIYGKQ